MARSALLSVHSSPPVVKQQKTSWIISLETKNSFYTCTKETNSTVLVCEAL